MKFREKVQAETKNLRVIGKEKPSISSFTWGFDLPLTCRLCSHGNLIRVECHLQATLLKTEITPNL